jgi:hypothetical protein
MQCTADFHHDIADIICSQTNRSRHNRTAFDTADAMLEPNTPTRNLTIFSLLLHGQFTTFGLLMRHCDCYAVERKAYKPEVLEQLTARS